MGELNASEKRFEEAKGFAECLAIIQEYRRALKDQPQLKNVAAGIEREIVKRRRKLGLPTVKVNKKK